MSVTPIINGQEIDFIYQGDEMIYPYPVTNGLEVWYDFYGKSNNNPDREVATDLSGNDNHGALQNFNFTSGSGYNQNGLVFDSVDDDVLTMNHSFSFGERETTIEICLDIQSNDRQIRAVLGFKEPEYKYFLYLNQGYLSFERPDQGSTINNYGYIQEGKTHVLLVGERNVHGILYMRLYINGERTDKTIFFNNLGSDYILSTIGNTRRQDRPLNTSVYSVRFYNRSLSESEIQHNYKVDKIKYSINN